MLALADQGDAGFGRVRAWLHTGDVISLATPARKVALRMAHFYVPIGVVRRGFFPGEAHDIIPKGNLGNVMKRWSNDRFLSPPHGVLNDSGTDRYSIAFFYSPNPGVVIECLPSCQG